MKSNKVFTILMVVIIIAIMAVLGFLGFKIITNSRQVDNQNTLKQEPIQNTVANEEVNNVIDTNNEIIENTTLEPILNDITSGR